MEIIKRPVLDGFMGAYWDINQAEPITIATLAKEQSIIDNYKKGDDIYINLAKQRWYKEHKDEAPVDWLNSQRKLYKQVFLSLLYGCGLNDLSESLSIDVKTAKSFITDFTESIPNIMKFIEYNYQYTQKNGKANTVLGEYIPINSNEAKTKSTNYVIQNYTSIILATFFYNVLENGLNLGFDISGKMFTHDSFIIEFPIKKLLHIDLLCRKFFQEACNKYFGIYYRYDWNVMFNLRNQYPYYFDFENKLLTISMWKEQSYYFLDHFRNGYKFNLLKVKEDQNKTEPLNVFYTDNTYKSHHVLNNEYICRPETTTLTLQILENIDNVDWFYNDLEDTFLNHITKRSYIDDLKKNLMERINRI